MKFNKYIWNIYKESQDGSSYIDYLLNLNYKKVKSELGDEKEQIELSNRLSIKIAPTKYAKDYFSKIKISSIEESTQQYEKFVQQGYPVDNKNLTLTEEEINGWYDIVISNITSISYGLYLAYPQYFIPYDFFAAFNQLQRICEDFNIPLPPLPNKNSKLDRALYYSKINQTFYEFRNNYDLNPAEMCAFLYDFAISYLKIEEEEMPTPSKVWLIQGGAGSEEDFDFVDEANKESTSYWQGNIDTRRGDILLMYCVSPRSYIHSIWRASSDGFIDPFFYYYNIIWISSPIKTVQVRFKEMKQHPLLSNNGYIKSSLQGPSGKPFSVSEYQSILEIMANKGQDLSVLPEIIVTSSLDIKDLTNERDVEIKLIEPFLSRLGYTPKDWIRGMPVRMGRGERNYPDYVFGAITKRGEESAKMLLESKFQITTKKQFMDAYYQAKSYALRLKSKVMILASKEGLYVFSYKGDFLSDYDLCADWKSLDDPDTFHKFLLILSKAKILG